MIKDDLINGKYKPGQKILIDDITAEYGISRTPAIQAVKLLVNENILDLMDNGKIFVPIYSAKQISDICDTRLLMEEYAIRFICKDHNASTIDMLNKIARRCDEYLREGDQEKSCKEDLSFHKAIIAATGNDCLQDLYTKIQGRFMVANFLTLSYELRLQDKAISGHKEIMESLIAFDTAAAQRSIQEHIYAIRDKLVDFNQKAESESAISG